MKDTLHYCYLHWFPTLGQWGPRHGLFFY